jgi:hypothetical protein
VALEDAHVASRFIALGVLIELLLSGFECLLENLARLLAEADLHQRLAHQFRRQQI